MSIQKSEFELEVNGKTAKAYLAAPQNGGPGVLVLHAWWGLKPSISGYLRSTGRARIYCARA